MTSCRFHGQAWSKTCQECSACLDQGAGPDTIATIVGRRARTPMLIESILIAWVLAFGIFLGWLLT